MNKSKEILDEKKYNKLIVVLSILIIFFIIDPLYESTPFDKR